MNISIVGAGYVGLVTGVCLADKGQSVLLVDIDSSKVDSINGANPPIHEKGLKDLLERTVSRTLQATTDLQRAVMSTDVTFITVGTPYRGDEIDLCFVKEASKQIGAALKEKSTYHLVVVKSTVVPGTTDDIIRPILEEASGKRAGEGFGLGMNPEFLREGEAVEDFMLPDRIVMGGIDERSIEQLELVYEAFTDVESIRTNNKTAEMIKYTSNALLATMISFSNEIANLSSALGGVDVVDVMKAVHLDKRLSPILPNGERVMPHFTSYLEAGCGFGGSCFPKDVRALISHGRKYGRPMKILEAVIRTNEDQPREIVSLLGKHFSSLQGLKISVLGLAFKPGTDDIRESPSLVVIGELLSRKAKIRAYDPVANQVVRRRFPDNGIEFFDNLDEAIENAEAIVVLTKWEEFARLPEMLRGRDCMPLIVDGRRMFERAFIERYEGIGVSCECARLRRDAE